MKLSHESTKVRSLGLVALWIVLGAMLSWHTVTVSRYIDIASSLGLRGEEPATPLAMAYPSFAADAQTWVRHALSLSEAEQFRLRFTQIDNGLTGREVHWNSAWAWAIAGAGWVEHWITGAPLPRATERATLWLPPVTFFFLIVATSYFAGTRAGLLAAIVVGFALLGHPRVYEGFFPTYVDHHGLLTLAAFGVTLGGAFMGLGWIRGTSAQSVLPETLEKAKAAAWFSALSGAGGVWVSAASSLPPIGIVGCAGLLALIVRGRAAQSGGAVFHAEVWRLWGYVGGGASLLFYLLEYFPNHLALRLESNHPLYSLAWAAGGVLIGELGEWWTQRRAPIGLLSLRTCLCVGAILIAPAVILLGGERVFVVADPFLANLHRSIQEFVPLWVSMRSAGWSATLRVVGVENIPLIAALVTIFVLKRRTPLVLAYGVIAALLFSAMGWLQSRWLLNASGSQIVLALLLLLIWTHAWRPVWRWAAAVACVAALYGQPALSRIVDARGDVAARRVSPKDALQPLWRDIAKAIRASAPDQQIVLLTNPNSSTGVGYYGRFKTIGTLYWENNAGLKAAASIFSAPDEATAGELIKKLGITHLALISEENFIEQYFRLWRPEASIDDFKRSFGYQVLVNRMIPSWLQMIPYKVPDDLGTLNVSVMLCKVAFNQTPADALYFLAISKIATGATADAEKDLDTLIQSSPEASQPWLRKAELAFARKDWDTSLVAILNGIKRSPAADRISLYANAASGFYREKLYRHTVALYKAALEERFDPTLATYLAFALSTAADDSVRDGKVAELIARKALELAPDSPTALNSLAVALAENGKFAEAVETAEKAVKAANLQGDAAAARISEQRLEAFKAGQPIRQ